MTDNVRKGSENFNGEGLMLSGKLRTFPVEGPFHERRRMQFRKQIVVIGDRILLQLDDGLDRTKSGLYLPASVREKEKVAMGKVVKVGPGYPIPNPNYTEDEPWSTPKDPMRYIPLQAKEGDYAIFLREQGIEVEFEESRYLIVPQSAVLMIVREQLSE
jgi:co-chaperonin GroES (HSP10)